MRCCACEGREVHLRFYDDMLSRGEKLGKKGEYYKDVACLSLHYEACRGSGGQCTFRQQRPAKASRGRHRQTLLDFSFQWSLNISNIGRAETVRGQEDHYVCKHEKCLRGPWNLVAFVTQDDLNLASILYCLMPACKSNMSVPLGISVCS
jgi:hypothetical protein